LRKRSRWQPTLERRQRKYKNCKDRELASHSQLPLVLGPE
jgi:hypothetical protein